MLVRLLKKKAPDPLDAGCASPARMRRVVRRRSAGCAGRCALFRARARWRIQLPRTSGRAGHNDDRAALLRPSRKLLLGGVGHVPRSERSAVRPRAPGSSMTSRVQAMDVSSFRRRMHGQSVLVGWAASFSTAERPTLCGRGWWWPAVAGWCGRWPTWGMSKEWSTVDVQEPMASDCREMRRQTPHFQRGSRPGLEQANGNSTGNRSGVAASVEIEAPGGAKHWHVAFASIALAFCPSGKAQVYLLETGLPGSTINMRVATGGER